MIPAGLGQEPPLQPLDVAALGPSDRLSAGQGLVAIPWKQQALQVVTEATALGQNREQGSNRWAQLDAGLLGAPRFRLEQSAWRLLAE